MTPLVGGRVGNGREASGCPYVMGHRWNQSGSETQAPRKNKGEVVGEKGGEEETKTSRCGVPRCAASRAVSLCRLAFPFWI